MAAPMGTWNVFISGAATPGALILSASTISTITGTLQTGASPVLPITAVWDETSQILSFSRAIAGGTGSNDAGFTIEVYTGTLFQAYATPNGTVSGEGVPLLLAGNFGTGQAGATVGPFNQAGWFATNTIKFKEKEGKESKDAKDHKDKDHKDGKEGKDGKEKEGHPDKLPELKTMEPSSQTDLASAMQSAIQTEVGATPEVRIAVGKSFIPSEERPVVGGTALQK